jgi:hypothetical protein
MGEAKRRKLAGTYPTNPRLAPEERSWLVGQLTVIANEAPCFEWRGTRSEALALQETYLNLVRIGSPVGAHSYAKRAAGYLMAYGMPIEGEADLRPANHGTRWDAVEIEFYKHAVLWLALCEPIPGRGKKVEDFFPGKSLLIAFTGDKETIIDATVRELSGQPFEQGNDFQMTVSIAGELPLDPGAAISMPEADLWVLADHKDAAARASPNKMIFLPRRPVDTAEAQAMLRMITVVADATETGLAAIAATGCNSTAALRTYAGYTDAELTRGRGPYVRVS